MDDQIKIRGFRVEPTEVETALARHPAIREALVAARPDAAGDQQLVACLVLNDERIRASELRQYLSDHLPEHLVPSVFARLPELPRTPNGKLHRKAIQTIALDRLDPSDSAVPARNPIEARMAELWCDVLGIAAVGINDNFFDLGGHSLLGARLLTRIKESFGVSLRPAALLKTPTVSALAAALFDRDQSPLLVKLQSGDLAEPFFCFPGPFLDEPMMLRARIASQGAGRG